MSKRTVLVTGTELIPDEVVASIAARGFNPRRIRRDQLTEAELVQALRGVSGYVLGGDERLTASAIESAVDLEVLAFVGMDYRAFVPGWQRAVERGIAVASCPGMNANAVAEFTVLLMLTMARPLTQRFVQVGEPRPGMELAGRSLGILGCGRIGARLVRIVGAGLGMRVRYHGHRRNEPLEHATGAEWVDWPELLATSDVLCLTRPCPAEHEPPVLGQAELALLPPNAIIVNIAHRDLIDPAALLKVTQDRGIRTAIDARCDGPSWQPLQALGPGSFLSGPQMGYNTIEANVRAATRAAQIACDVLDGVAAPAVHNPDFRAVRLRARRPTAL